METVLLIFVKFCNLFLDFIKFYRFKNIFRLLPIEIRIHAVWISGLIFLWLEKKRYFYIKFIYREYWATKIIKKKERTENIKRNKLK